MLQISQWPLKAFGSYITDTYFSNSNCTSSILTYTGENLFNDYLDDIELFLNGLVEL